MLSYQAAANAAERAAAANDLYLRHLPLVRKTLERFCRASHCYAGGCPVEDLVGESYAAFRTALDEYDPGRGVDFLGFAAQRLYWASRHRLRELRRSAPVPDAPELHPEENPEQPERSLLLSLWIRELLEALSEEDADLLRRRYGEGCSCGELARRLGLTPAAARKRLERARSRARQLLVEPAHEAA